MTTKYKLELFEAAYRKWIADGRPGTPPDPVRYELKREIEKHAAGLLAQQIEAEVSNT